MLLGLELPVHAPSTRFLHAGFINRRGAAIAGAAGILAALVLLGTSVADAHLGSPPNPVTATAAGLPGHRPASSRLNLSVVDADIRRDSPALLARRVSATPDGPWRVVGRWQSLIPAMTDQFTVTSPWRIRWRLQSDDEPFVAVLEPGPDGPILLSGEEGVTQGAFYIGPAGTFMLVVRTQVPWELAVEDLGPEERSVSR